MSDITSITRDGSTPGTIAYMSPEQTRGDEVDARTDVWSLGVVSYEMLTGERPFQGDNSDIIIFGIRHDQPRSLDELPNKVPEDLASIVGRMLEKDRKDRYSTAGEVLADLRSGEAGPKAVSSSTATKPASIALLPLVSMTRDPEQEWFTDGMTDALITDLAKVTGLRIISLGSVMPYKDTTKAPPQIAEELGVDYLVEGSIARLDDEIKVSARLIDAFEDRYLWAESYERPFASTLRLQGEIARSIARHIRIELTPGEEKRFSHAHTVDSVTHEMYLKGMYHLNKFTPDGMERGLDYLSRAVERAPDDPLVHAGLALGYMLVAHTPSPPPDTVPNARKAIKRALDLDAEVAEVHLSLAMISVYSDWEREAGKRAYERALELNPSLAMAHAHSGWLHAVDGEVEEGLSSIRQAQSLDPLNAIHSAWLGELYFLEGYFDEAIEEALKAVELNPDFPIGLFVLGAGYAAKGRFDEAIEMHKKAAATGPDYAWCLGETYALNGDVDRAREIAATIENKPTVWDSYGLARIYRALGDDDMVFQWLEAGYQQRHPYIQWFQLPGNFGTLRDDPRYGDLSVRLGLGST
jgi:TolB-like protein/Flp pilus assembly protein TadD